MSDDPQSHNFNWVEARRACSLLCEALKLGNTVKQSVEERRKNAESDRRANIEFREISKDHFCVCHRPTPSYDDEDFDWCVHFIRETSRIAITQSNRKGSEKRFDVTLTLNDEGLCRYKIDGRGEYLRWQVARKALEPFMFSY